MLITKGQKASGSGNKILKRKYFLSIKAMEALARPAQN